MKSCPSQAVPLTATKISPSATVRESTQIFRALSEETSFSSSLKFISFYFNRMQGQCNLSVSANVIKKWFLDIFVIRRNYSGEKLFFTGYNPVLNFCLLELPVFTGEKSG